MFDSSCYRQVWRRWACAKPTCFESRRSARTCMLDSCRLRQMCRCWANGSLVDCKSTVPCGHSVFDPRHLHHDLMKLAKALTETGMARSGAEAQRLVKQGAVLVGGCTPLCPLRATPPECTCQQQIDEILQGKERIAKPCRVKHGVCTCGGWTKIINPAEEIESGVVMRIGKDDWRLVQREGSAGFDQVRGVARVP